MLHRSTYDNMTVSIYAREIIVLPDSWEDVDVLPRIGGRSIIMPKSMIDDLFQMAREMAEVGERYKYQESIRNLRWYKFLIESPFYIHTIVIIETILEWVGISNLGLIDWRSSGF